MGNLHQRSSSLEHLSMHAYFLLLWLSFLASLGVTEKCAVVIDVRTQGEYETGHVSCAHRVPIQDNPNLYRDDIDNLTGGDVSNKFVLYCASGGRASYAVGIMKSWGYTNVGNGGGYASNRLQLESICACTPAPSTPSPAQTPMPSSMPNKRKDKRMSRSGKRKARRKGKRRKRRAETAPTPGIRKRRKGKS